MNSRTGPAHFDVGPADGTWLLSVVCRSTMTQQPATVELARPRAHGEDAPGVSYAAAVAYCRHLARSHDENFTVASWLLPRRLLRHWYAIYAYCRAADDLADESGDADESLRRLDDWERQLDDCYTGRAQHPIFVALARTIEDCGIPRQPLADLLAAFRQDQRVRRYETADDVLAYCRNSANPVGRLILYVGDCHDDVRGRLSDSICTGLQLANFCQDVARDAAMGRLYLPLATLERAGYTLDMWSRAEFNDTFRRALRTEVDRAEQYLHEGEPLVALMPRELQLEVSLFVTGGLEILRAIREQDYDVWRARPRVSNFTKLRLLTRAWWQTRARRLRHGGTGRCEHER
jgi:squalene synthase HpnC